VRQEPPLDEKVVLVHRALDDAQVDHAFGGALALAYYAEPRATIDVDVNVFVAPRRAGKTFDAFARLGATVDRPALLEKARRDGQARVRWGRTPFDLFFSYDPFHEACHAARRIVPFGDADIPILAPEHLIVCKTVFDRRKDWLDIEQILFTTARELDVREVRNWTGRIVGQDDRRAKHLERLIAATVG
jgi:hypothetical protein